MLERSLMTRSLPVRVMAQGFEPAPGLDGPVGQLEVLPYRFTPAALLVAGAAGSVLLCHGTMWVLAGLCLVASILLARRANKFL